MSNTKRGLGLLLSVTMIFTLLVTGFPSGFPMVMAAEETGMPDYIWYGDGSGSTYEISGADQLAGLTNIVNGTDGQTRDDFKGKTITLTSDIDLSVYGKGASFNDGKGWIPIGYYPDSYFDRGPFRGTFDGGNHAITGFYINNENGEYENTGLFGNVFVGTVKNLRVIDMEINGGSCIGGVVGWIEEDAIVENCYTSGKVSSISYYVGGMVGAGDSSSVINCYSECDVSGESSVGGLVGSLSGNVESCYATGKVSGSVNYIGGLVGYLSGIAKNCYATGEVSGGENGSELGGLLGYLSRGSVKNCYATGEVSSGDDIYNVGGLVGKLYIGDMENCYATSVVSGGENGSEIGGLVGYLEDGNMKNCSATGIVSCGDNSFRVGGLVGKLYNGSMKNCSAAGDVSGGGDSYIVGGLAGYLENVNVERCYATGDISSISYVGGLAGYLVNVSVESCSALGAVSGGDDSFTVGGLVGELAGGSVKNCYATGVVSGDRYMGGLVSSFSNGSMENCYATGKVSGDSFLGGLASYLENVSVENCYATGDVNGSVDSYIVGGLVGYLNGGSAENCYTAGNISSGGNRIGGLVGYLYNNSVKNCVALNPSVSGDADAGRVVGWDYGITLDNNWAYDGMDIKIGDEDKDPLVKGHDKIDGADITMDEALTAAFWTDTMDWGGDGIWTITDGVLPVLGSHFTGLGTQHSPYIISTVEDLANLARLVNAGNEKYNAAHYLLEGNIDLSGYGASNDLFNDGKGWIPIGTYSDPFRGTFDGGNHTVTGLFIDDENRDYVGTGLFGALFEGTIKNLHVIDMEINGGIYIGGVVGLMVSGGGVENCHVSGTIIGSDYVGGLVGYLDGSVENCYATGNVSSSGNQIGGLVGYLDGSVENCYATGNVSGSGNHIGGLVGSLNGGSMENCYATGVVSGNWGVGGLVGILNSGSGKNCYTTGTVSGDSSIGGLVGYLYDSSVDNCVALNQNVSINDENTGRVVGLADASTLENNRAYADMDIKIGTEDKDPLDNVHDGIDGADITMDEALKAAFWTDAMGWDGDDVWSFADGNLPVSKVKIRITAHPESINITEGSFATLTVDAYISSGDELIYQWYSNTTNSNSTGTAVNTATYPTAASASFDIPVNLTEGTYYYYCEVSAAGANSVYSSAATVTVTHSHDFGTKWKSAADNHWHECGCGEKNDTAAHTPGSWIVDVAATTTTVGSRHKECTVCKYVTATEGIPAISMFPTKTQFTYSLNAKTYNGKVQGVSVTSKSGVGKVTAIYYNKSKTVPNNAGSYVVTLDVAAGTQYGAVTGLSLGTFTINKANLSKIKTSVADTVWTGKQIRPNKFTYNGISFSVSNYAIVNSYGKNKDIGKGTISLGGKGNFTGTKTITFRIAPKKNSVSKVTVGKKQMKVQWRKSSAAQKITKYEVRYRVKGTSKWKTKSYAASLSSVTIKNLTKGKQYELQVRSYKTVSGVKYYSAWSAKRTSGKIK